jgi:hypothetical protein
VDSVLPRRHDARGRLSAEADALPFTLTHQTVQRARPAPENRFSTKNGIPGNWTFDVRLYDAVNGRRSFFAPLTPASELPKH